MDKRGNPGTFNIIQKNSTFQENRSAKIVQIVVSICLTAFIIIRGLWKFFSPVRAPGPKQFEKHCYSVCNAMQCKLLWIWTSAQGINVNIKIFL